LALVSTARADETPVPNPDSSPLAPDLPPCRYVGKRCYVDPTPADNPLGVVAPPPTISRLQRDPGRVRTAKILAVSGGAAFVASLGVATYARHEYDGALAKGDVHTANRWVDLAHDDTWLGGAGVACALAAAVVYFTAPTEWVVVSPMASPTSAGFSLTAQF
jgi:hypothetical protein